MTSAPLRLELHDLTRAEWDRVANHFASDAAADPYILDRRSLLAGTKLAWCLVTRDAYEFGFQAGFIFPRD